MDHSGAPASPLELRIIVVLDDGLWVARGVEHDVCACSVALEHLHAELADVLRFYEYFSEDNDPLRSVPVAPDDVWRDWERGSPIPWDDSEGFRIHARRVDARRSAA